MHPGIYETVLRWIPEKSRVLDLGTGDGAFLARLVQTRHVIGEGVEKAADDFAGEVAALTGQA